MQFTVFLLFLAAVKASDFSGDPTSLCINYLEEVRSSGANPDVDVVRTHLTNTADPLKVAPLLMAFQDDEKTCRYHELLSSYYDFGYEDWFAYIKSNNYDNLSCSFKHAKHWMFKMGHPLVLYAAEQFGMDERTLVIYLKLFASYEIRPSLAELKIIKEKGLNMAADVFNSFQFPADFESSSFYFPELDQYLNACAEVRTKPSVDWHLHNVYFRADQIRAAVLRNLVENDQFDYNQDF